MKNLTVLVAEKELILNYVSSISSGYGHKKITVELMYCGECKSFSCVTNNMPGYDAACELEGNEKYHALYELIEHKILNEVSEWIENIEE